MRFASKSATAFMFSAEAFFAECPKVYFWTFTFRQVPRSHEWALWAWAKLMREISKAFPMCRGVRVCELHQNHGLHFHALINERIPIERLRRMAAPLGFGILWVEKCDSGIAGYLAKYLSKGYREKEPSMGRRRRWGAIGGLKVTRARDIVYDTSYSRTKEAVFPGEQIPYALAMLIRNYVTLYGEYDEWPTDLQLAIRSANNRSYESLRITQVAEKLRAERKTIRLANLMVQQRNKAGGLLQRHGPRCDISQELQHCNVSKN